ncbi:uncharacterized protein LOC106179023 isoform X2 [Lingula anatina]|nr:uncharacterized protein LOC106179023 isoform X2 [Lingula anatina]XP_013417958.1 uncharacterized protein LOC106179023 isoform X2 [Lingula anatina]|eukprot:XP_013417957.1 uncharacterized protein LOC106179023 isoform X2 [Lingula anatina]
MIRILLSLLIIGLAGKIEAADHVLDMTYPLGPNTTYWPGTPKFHFSIDFRNFSATTGWYEGNSFCAATNGGTSLEAPSFLIQGGTTADNIPVHKLIGPAVKIDIASKAATDPDVQLTVEDIENWEIANGRVPDNSILFVYTGWGQYVDNRTAFFGHPSTTEWLDPQGRSLLHFPGISPAATSWLASNRKLLGIGIDTPSLDYGQSVDKAASVALYSKGIYGLTTVANLDKLPTKGATVLAFPVTIRGSSGGPVRIVALLRKTLEVKESDVIDMTYVYSVDTTYWPGAGSFNITSVVKGPSGNITWLDKGYFCTPEHGGSHFDFPAHMFRGGYRSHDVSVEKVIGPAVKVDIQGKANQDRDALLSVDDLEKWETVNGKIPDNAIVFVQTGWGRYYGNRTAYLGSSDTQVWTDSAGKSQLHFPGISEEAANWLKDNRKISGVGIDTASLDRGQTVNFESHVAFFSVNIYGVENVGYLDKLPTTGTTAYILPMYLFDGSGGPARIVAIKEKEGKDTSGVSVTSSSSFVLIITISLHCLADFF